MREQNHVHPSAIIGENVRMGSGNIIGPNAVIVGDVILGDRNWIGPNVVIGLDGDLFGRPKIEVGEWWGSGLNCSEFGVRIGSASVLKEGVSIHAGSHRHTEIGDNAYLMPRSHLGHDCWLGDRVTMSPNSQIAGHVSVGSAAVLGMGSLVHQFCTVGPVAMVGMGAVVRSNVMPGRTVVGDPARVSGINRVGLSRFLHRETDSSTLNALKSENTWGTLPEDLFEEILTWEKRCDEVRLEPQ